jgi:hypothetical protein
LSLARRQFVADLCAKTGVAAFESHLIASEKSRRFRVAIEFYRLRSPHHWHRIRATLSSILNQL